jgi:WD40 repeat protein
VLSVAFSPDGRQVAAGSAMWSTEQNAQSKGMAQRWDAADGHPIGVIEFRDESQEGVMDLAFGAAASHPGSDQLLAASFDPYIVQLWDIDRPESTQFTFEGHQSQVVAVAVSSDDARIVSASADGTLRIWPNLPTTAADDALCAKLTENMSQRNWSEWVSGDIPFQPICSTLPSAASDAMG